MPSLSDQPASFRLQIASIPEPVLSAWRSRYAAGGGIELNALALVDEAAAALRRRGEQADARSLWVRLADQCGQTDRPSPEMMAAAALVGLATGLRTQGFDRLEMPEGREDRNAVDTP